MYKWFKVLITNIDCALPPEMAGKWVTEAEANKYFEEKRSQWPQVLQFEIECEDSILTEKLNELVSKELGVGINSMSYEILDWEGIGLA